MPEGEVPVGEVPGSAAAALVALLTARGLTAATAESLTGGLVCAALVDVPGASAAVRGGVVAYATELKGSLLGVSAQRLAATGPVDGVVAAQLALGARRVLGADVGLATTGVAGPGPDGPHPAGTVHVAVAADGLPGGVRSSALLLPGDRAAVRAATVEAVLRLALAVLGADAPRTAAEQGGPAGS